MFAFESVQFVVMLMEDMTDRVQARSGLRGVRMGEASNPSTPNDQVLVSTTVISSMGIENALEFDLTDGSCSDIETCVQEPQKIANVVGSFRARSQNTVAPRGTSGGSVLHTSVARIGAVPAGSDVPRIIRLQDVSERCSEGRLVGIPTI